MTWHITAMCHYASVKPNSTVHTVPAHPQALEHSLSLTSVCPCVSLNSSGPQRNICHLVTLVCPYAPCNSSIPLCIQCHLVTLVCVCAPLLYLFLHTDSCKLCSRLACYFPLSVPFAASLPSGMLLQSPGCSFS